MRQDFNDEQSNFMLAWLGGIRQWEALRYCEFTFDSELLPSIVVDSFMSPLGQTRLVDPY